MSMLRKHATFSTMVGIVMFLLVVTAGATTLIAARSVADVPAAASETHLGEPQLDLSVAVCEGSPVEISASKKPCRNACQDKPYCTCTYNGQPRVSCDPCCYQTYTGWICLD